MGPDLSKMNPQLRKEGINILGTIGSTKETLLKALILDEYDILDTLISIVQDDNIKIDLETNHLILRVFNNFLLQNGHILLKPN